MFRISEGGVRDFEACRYQDIGARQCGFPKPTGVPKQAHNTGYDTILTAPSVSHIDTAMAEAHANKIAAGTETNAPRPREEYNQRRGACRT